MDFDAIFGGGGSASGGGGAADAFLNSFGTAGGVMNNEDMLAASSAGGPGSGLQDMLDDFGSSTGGGGGGKDGSPTGGDERRSLSLKASTQAEVLAGLSQEDSDYLAEIEIPIPSVQNIIASVKLQCELDLRRVAISARNAEYNPRKLNAVIVRIREPKCTGLVFRNGRLMLTGAKSPEDVKLAGKKIAKLCLKAGHPDVKFFGFKIENYIATVDCRFPVRLEGLAVDHREFCSYECELFPGLIYRLTASEDCKAVLMIFSSGKVIITGCKSAKEVEEVFSATFPVLIQYRK